MATPSRGPTSPQTRNSAVQVLSVPPGMPVVVRFLGPIRGLEVHWQGKRSVPCDGDAGCLPAIHRTPKVWKGYAPVEQWHPSEKLWRAWVLEVTSNLEETLRDRELRGETWTLFREGKGRNNDPVLGVYCERVPESKLSACFDIVPVLVRVFNKRVFKLDIPNTLAPKVFIEPVAGNAPKLPAELLPDPEPQEDPAAREKLREMMRNLRGGSSTGKTATDQAGKDPSSNGKH